MLGTTGPSFNVICGDSFKEIKGKELIQLYKARKDSKSTMFIAQCCKACVAIHNSGLAPNQFICPADVCIINSKQTEISHRNVEARLWMKDALKSFDPNFGEMPPFTGNGP